MKTSREHILDTAQHLAQERGFNAFSYADLAEAVGIRKASIHHHFPSKEDLELELVRRYTTEFAEQLASISRGSKSAEERLRHYCQLYTETLAGGGICLCGMMASDLMALPASVRQPLNDFFVAQADWLSGVLAQGQAEGEFRFNASPAIKARTLLAALQGGLVVARAQADTRMFSELVDDLLAGLVR